MEKKVSIIMGVYNGSQRIEKALNSIQNQTYKNWEFIICDDASTDDSYGKLQSFEKQESRIKLLRNEKNLGLAGTLNHCLQHCTGEYIARQDDDDTSLPNRFQVQMDFLSKHLEIQFVASRVNLTDADGKKWGELGFKESPSINDLIRRGCFVHPTVMMRKSALDAVGGYNDKAIRVEDYDLWFRFYEKGFKGYNLPECLYNYTVGLGDYEKRKYKYRYNEFKTRLNGYSRNQVPILKRVWAFKPLIAGIVPDRLMHFFHKKTLAKDEAT
jgi:glycosyltransferase EpsE